MKTIFSSEGLDFIIRHDTVIKEGTKSIGVMGDNEPIYKLENKVIDAALFVQALGRKQFIKVELSSALILALADHIRSIASEKVPNGIPTYDYDDIPF